MPSLSTARWRSYLSVTNDVINTERSDLTPRLTFGKIVPCLSPVSRDLNTLVTSSNSLLVNSSGWLIMLLFT